MLDTNMVSYAIKGKPPRIRERLAAVPRERVIVSAVTEAELMYGLARRGNPTGLSNVVREFLVRVEVLPWDSEVARVYGGLRASCTAAGITLGALDMMIAAHAIAFDAVLVTADQAFGHIPLRLKLEDWTKEGSSWLTPP